MYEWLFYKEWLMGINNIFDNDKNKQLNDKQYDNLEEFDVDKLNWNIIEKIIKEICKKN